MFIKFVISFIIIMSSMYGMLKFMLKGSPKRIQLLEKNLQEFKDDREENQNQELIANNKSDELYRQLLEQTYGKNIPEEIK